MKPILITITVLCGFLIGVWWERSTVGGGYYYEFNSTSTPPLIVPYTDDWFGEIEPFTNK